MKNVHRITQRFVISSHLLKTDPKVIQCSRVPCQAVSTRTKQRVPQSSDSNVSIRACPLLTCARCNDTLAWVSLPGLIHIELAARAVYPLVDGQIKKRYDCPDCSTAHQVSLVFGAFKTFDLFPCHQRRPSTAHRHDCLSMLLGNFPHGSRLVEACKPWRWAV